MNDNKRKGRNQRIVKNIILIVFCLAVPFGAMKAYTTLNQLYDIDKTKFIMIVIASFMIFLWGTWITYDAEKFFKDE